MGAQDFVVGGCQHTILKKDGNVRTVCEIRKLAQSNPAARDPMVIPRFLYQRQQSCFRSVAPKGNTYKIGNTRYGLQFLNEAAFHISDIKEYLFDVIELGFYPIGFSRLLGQSLHVLRRDFVHPGSSYYRNFRRFVHVALRHIRTFTTAKAL